jgi:hypothetical protein
MNEERTGKCLRQVEHIHYHLRHRYCITVSDFSTLMENRNNFQCSQDFCAKSFCKLICLKSREISIMVIPL